MMAALERAPRVSADATAVGSLAPSECTTSVRPRRRCRLGWPSPPWCRRRSSRRRLRRGQEILPSSRARGHRRRAGRVRQLRHQRRYQEAAGLWRSGWVTEAVRHPSDRRCPHSGPDRGPTTSRLRLRGRPSSGVLSGRRTPCAHAAEPLQRGSTFRGAGPQVLAARRKGSTATRSSWQHGFRSRCCRPDSSSGL